MRKTRIFNLIMVIILCLGSFGSLSAPAAAQQPEETVVARIYYNDRAGLEQLSARLDVWEVNQAEGYLVAMLSAERFEQLKQAGYRLEIDQAKTDMIHQPLVPLPGQSPDEIPGYPCYRTVEETDATLQELAAQYPDLTELFDIGDSWEKVTPDGLAGYDITAIRITNEDPAFGPIEDKPVFFLMAEIHAREYTTAEMATLFIEYLLDNYDNNADIQWLLDYYQIHVVPMSNPDGRKLAEAGDSWRKNTDSDDGCTYSYAWGTDLNRNYGFHWEGGGSSTYPCDETYRGPSADSEPETQNIENYVLTLFDDQRGPLDTDPAPITTTGSLITLHSYSELVLWPWGWTGTDAPNHIQLQTLGRKLAYFNSYTPQQSNNLYPTNGTTDDWSYGELGIASYTFEMGTDFFQDCTTFQNTIYPKNRQALLYAFKATRQPYMDPKGPESLYPSALPDEIHPGQSVNLTATANDERYGGGEPTQNIAAARYSIDIPSWIEGAVTYPMQASDGSFNAKTEGIQATVDTSQLGAGRHIIFVESQDADGNWGVPSAVFLTVAAELTPDTAQAEVPLGEVITYTLQYTNGLKTNGDFNVTVTSNWPASAPTSLGSLGSMGSTSFNVAVTVPVNAADGQIEEAIVKVYKAGDPDIYDTSQFLTTATARGVVITPTNVTGQGYPGMDVVYVMNVANRGTLSDTFDLQSSSNWTATLSTETIGPLEPDEEATLVLTVTVPVSAISGDSDTAVITATSQFDPDKFAVATRTTLAQWRGAEIAPETASAVGSPGETITYTLTVTNVGDITDTFAVSAEADWLTSVPALVGPLEPGGSTLVQVAVTIPEDAASGNSDTASILVHSELPGSLDAWATLTTTAQADYSLQVTAEDDSMTASAASMPVTFTLHLTNTGSVTDTYDLTITSTWTVEYSSPIGPLAAGESQTIFVVVQVPPDAIIGDVNVATLRFTSQADPLVSRQLDLTTLFVWYNLFLPIIVK